MPFLSWLRPIAPCTAPRALGWYIVVTLAFTWPLAAGLSRDVPRDLGDSLLNSWILAWNASHVLDAMRGDPGVLRELWHGNIFHPEPYTLAYSELLLAPSLQIVPVYAVTGNLVLCYNLLFLSTYVLSGLGMFLLARAYTDDWRAAFVAGLLYAFTPYRVNQGPHLQVMTSQWMPFVLYGFHRFVETQRLRAAIGGATALVAQNLSCGYFMIFFAPFVPAFVLFEMHRARAWRNVRIWAGFALAAVFTAAATLPAMQPYMALRALHGSRRSMQEILLYSADAWGWLSAIQELRFWWPILNKWVKPEGQLFPGALPILLGTLAIVAGALAMWRASRGGGPTRTQREGGIAERLVVMAVTALGGFAVVLAVASATGLTSAFAPTIQTPVLRFENQLMALAVIAVTLAVLSTRARTVLALTTRSPIAFAALAAAVAWYLSLGPAPHAGGQPIAGPRLYPFLLDHLPGMDGLRVPARYAMLAIMFLSWLAAWGVRAMLSPTRPGAAYAVIIVLSATWMAETWHAPMRVNDTIGSTVEGISNPPARIPNGTSIPALARFLRELPPSSVLLHFPFAAGGWEMRHVYYSTLHWRRLVNGFSGYAPPSYDERARLLRDPAGDPDGAWRSLLASGATHVVVHGQAYVNRRAPAPFEWLESHGMRRIAQFGLEEVYLVPRQP